MNLYMKNVIVYFERRYHTAQVLKKKKSNYYIVKLPHYVWTKQGMKDIIIINKKDIFFKNYTEIIEKMHSEFLVKIITNEKFGLDYIGNINYLRSIIKKNSKLDEIVNYLLKSRYRHDSIEYSRDC